MEATVQYRPMKPGEVKQVCDLIVRVFNEFIAQEYSKEGVQEFLQYVTPEAMLERSENGNFVLVGVVQNDIVGMIETREYNHVSLLFVDKAYHRRGISRELLRRAVNICLKQNPNLGRISVNASPYAVEIYKRLGFRQTKPEQAVNGIRFAPMVLGLDS